MGWESHAELAALRVWFREHHHVPSIAEAVQIYEQRPRIRQRRDAGMCDLKPGAQTRRLQSK